VEGIAIAMSCVVNAAEYRFSDGAVSCVVTVDHGRIQRDAPRS